MSSVKFLSFFCFSASLAVSRYDSIMVYCKLSFRRELSGLSCALELTELSSYFDSFPTFNVPFLKEGERLIVAGEPRKVGDLDYSYG